MECPKCQENNPADAYYCHMCGHQLRWKINGWRLFSIIISLLFILLGIVFFMYYRNAEQRISDGIEAENRAYYAESRANEAELRAEEAESRANEAELRAEEAESRANEAESRANEAEESKIPQQYYTRYKDQNIYYWDGSFKKTSYMYGEVGTYVEIYEQKDGYGLSSYGWIPMDCLRK